MSEASGEKAALLDLLKRHGWNATSFQVLEPGYGYWFDGPDACVAYVDTGSAWVAAGAPIAAPDALAAVAERFCDAALRAGRRACFFATEERFTRMSGLAALQIGEQPVWDPSRWEETLASNRSLREQLRRARAKGLVVRPVAPEALASDAHPVRRELERMTQRWLRSRPMAPMGFLVQLHLDTFVLERRCFVAEREGRVLGLLHAVPVYGRGGWFFEDVLRDPHAPNGTTELLVDAAMRAASDAGSRFVTLGLAPLAGETSGALQLARTLGRALYDFEGLRAFKAKLRPHQWMPVYLSYPPTRAGPVAIFDSLRAFARGGFLRFGLATLMRGPATLVRLMTAMLVPWTIALAAAPTEFWFPSPAVKWGWVAFDVLLFAGLLRLTLGWRRSLAKLLAGLITLDCAATLLQVVTFNAPRARSWLDVLVLFIAVLAPGFSALLLWRALAHRRALD